MFVIVDTWTYFKLCRFCNVLATSAEQALWDRESYKYTQSLLQISGYATHIVEMTNYVSSGTLNRAHSLTVTVIVM